MYDLYAFIQVALIVGKKGCLLASLSTKQHKLPSEQGIIVTIEFVQSSGLEAWFYTKKQVRFDEGTVVLFIESSRLPR